MMGYWECGHCGVGGESQSWDYAESKRRLAVHEATKAHKAAVAKQGGAP